MFLMDMLHQKKNACLTSWSVIALGALVTLAGVAMTESDERVRAGMTGFGVAHILLGVLDLFRIGERNRF